MHVSAYMKRTLKRLADQVVVVTGASSGIGLTTAELAAKEGARVVLAARSEADLGQATEWIRRSGGRATFVVPALIAAVVADLVMGDKCVTAYQVPRPATPVD